MTRIVLLTFAAFVLLSACTGQRLLPPPPTDAYQSMQVPGYPRARSWGDEIPKNASQSIAEIRRHVMATMKDGASLPNDGVVDVLVLSGGGSDGAYGAGLLNGWSDRKGGRPEFWIVTGISTGALIAPYVFVGAEYDDELERFYTNTKTEDLIVFRLLDAIFGDRLGVADTTRLIATLDRALSPSLLERIAAEHARGRRLLIGTTNLDAQRPVVWNIGAIAASGEPGAARLIRDILLASASIPGAFPPVEIAVEADGRRYGEMHVDGGVTRQLFFLPVGFRIDNLDRRLHEFLTFGTVYVLRNTKLAPSFAPTEPEVIEITARSISTLIKAAGVADVQVIEAQARDNGFGLKVTAVPESFDVDEEELFDPVYMRALYNLGYNLALTGDPWTEIAAPVN